MPDIDVALQRGDIIEVQLVLKFENEDTVVHMEFTDVMPGAFIIVSGSGEFILQGTALKFEEKTIV